MLRVDPGFDAENVLTMRLRLPDAKYDTAEKMQAFYEEMIRRVAALPGVRSAGVTNGFPLGNADSDGYSVEGQPATQPGEELTFAGIVLGLASSFALTRVIASLLFRVSATDPLTFISLPLLLAAVALLACWLPARRATKVDPLVAIRRE